MNIQINKYISIIVRSTQEKSKHESNISHDDDPMRRLS